MLAPGDPAVRRYPLFLLHFFYAGKGSSAQSEPRQGLFGQRAGGEVPAPGTHNQQPEYLVFAIFIRSIPPAGQITGNWRKQAAGYRLATAGTISTHGLSQHLEVQLVALIRVLPSHRLIQRDTQARLS